MNKQELKLKLKAIKWRKVIMQLIAVVFGSFLIAFAMHVFIIPAKFAPGGVSGLTSIIQNIWGFSASYSLIIFNAPLVILAFIFLSKPLALKTAVAIVLSSLFLQVFQITKFYTFIEESGHILGALAGGILSGSGIGILVKIGASSGGTDIIGMLIQRKTTSLSISWLIFFLNMLVITFGATLYITVGQMPLNQTIGIVLYSLVMVFLSSKSMEIVLNGMSSAVKFEVITSKPNELGKAIINTLSRGVTIINSRGAYTDTDNSVLICVVTKRQITPFRKLLKEIDPMAFAFAMDTREVLGNGFKRQK